jgi:pyruvate/2-oxoglutarate dehydrogenase complex dihydrolipoamide acyltransferase (E2) component
MVVRSTLARFHTYEPRPNAEGIIIMFTEPRHRRRGVIVIAAILLALLIAAPVALRRPEASSQPLVTTTPSADALEAQRASQAHLDRDPWEGLPEAIRQHEEKVHRFLAAVAAEEARVAAEKAAAHAEWHRQQDALKAAAAKKAAAAAAAKPSAAPAAASSSYSGDVWHDLAMCETGGKMDNPNTGNGYYGYFQFSLGTWQSVGGTGYPHEHSYGTQKAFAQKLQARSGWGQWPACSAKLGLR